MPDTCTLPAPPDAPPADSPQIADSFELALDAAFPPIDAPQDALAQLADSPATPELLAVAPRPALISLEELIREIANRPLIIIRQIGVPLAALLAVAGALFLHLLLVGAFLLAIYFNLRHAHPGSARDTNYADGAGSGDGYMILGDAPLGPAALNGNIDDLLSHSFSAPSPVPSIPPLPDRASPANIAAQQLAAADPTEPDLIGSPSGIALIGQPRSPFTPAVQPSPTMVRVAPPSVSFPSKLPAVKTPPIAGRTGPNASSPRPGIGDGGGDDEGPPLALLKPGSGGIGHSHGNNSGNGSGAGDRGDSAANNPNPSVLDAPQIDLPIQFQQNPPQKNAVFEVVVRADGTPGTITLTESCGNKDIDDLCLAAIRRYRFRPAYVAGSPIEKTMTITQDFGAIH